MLVKLEVDVARLGTAVSTVLGTVDTLRDT